ncbi:MAG: hypothetical protein DID90_2727554680 [Candidatus Nitrotoga sp. LAW]|nr:MAG: hypothetical protein DID90_2727554680 [Candidatus Nitrotoga sp. LAW]
MESGEIWTSFHSTRTYRACNILFVHRIICSSGLGVPGRRFDLGEFHRGFSLSGEG